MKQSGDSGVGIQEVAGGGETWRQNIIFQLNCIFDDPWTAVLDWVFWNEVKAGRLPFLQTMTTIGVNSATFVEETPCHW